MSYAIAPTFEANKIGVRRVYTLGMFRGMSGAPDPDTIAALLAAGYTQDQISTLQAFNVTDEQLLALPYPASQQEMDNSFQTLLQQLSAASTSTPVIMQTSAAGAAYGAVATTIQSPFGGIFDLTKEADWAAISSLFTMVQQQWNAAVQAQGGKPDADTINGISNFNQLVAKWASYYAQAFGSAPPSLPYASATGLSGTLGVAPAIAVALIAGVVVLLVGLYASYQAAQVLNAKYAGQAKVQTTAITGAQASANTLLAQAAALPASQAAQATQLRAQAAALLGQTVTSTTPASTTALTTWFTQNWIGVAAVLIGLAVLPTLAKKL